MAANRQKTLTTQDMKKHLLPILLTVAGMLPAMAQVQFGTNQYAVRLNIGYNHNTTYGSYAGVDFGAFMPINQHFEMQADLRFTTANNHAIGVQMRPKFAVPVGEFFLEGRLLSGLYPKDGFQRTGASHSRGLSDGICFISGRYVHASDHELSLQLARQLQHHRRAVQHLLQTGGFRPSASIAVEHQPLRIEHDRLPD